MKKFLALTMALVMGGFIGTPFITAQAEGLTQASNPDEVNYAQVTEEDSEILKEIFDVDYYLKNNPDLKDLYGNDFDKLFEHFIKCGVFEGRSCNPNFDPSAYASAYSDLKDLFGTDILQYYKHYATVGIAENRTLTTLEACAKSGITVHPLNKESVSITPEIFRLAKAFNSTSIDAVTVIAESVNRAHERNASIIISKPSNKALERAKGLEKVGTLTLGDNQQTSLDIYIYEGKQGYAAYAKEGLNIDANGAGYEKYMQTVYTITVDTVPVCVTDDYVAFTLEDLNNGDGSLREHYAGSVYATITNAPINTFDPKNCDEGDPHYKKISESDSQWPSGIMMYSNGGSSTTGINGKEYRKSIDIVSIDSTYRYEGKYELDGVYTDNNGNWKTFDSPQERYEYLQSKTITEERMGGTSVSYVPEESNPKLNVDRKGNTDTVYNVGMKMNQSEDGQLTLDVGISNDETGYGYVVTYEYNNEEITH